ncbi:MAG: magnesium transporter CorA family protein [Deltaproteobacteria bacterium]|nr:magnesium transporter CorA family protein [Deltaproteobacteria bacterium]
MLKTFSLDAGRIVECFDGSGCILVYLNPDEKEKKYLTGTLSVDEHTLSSALDPDELARLEFEPEHVALIYKRPKMHSDQRQFFFPVASTGLFLFKQKLVMVVADDVPIFEGKQFAKVTSLPDVILKLISRATTRYLDNLKIINQMTEEIEAKIFSAMENRHLLSLFALEKSLVYYLNAINSNSMLIDKMKFNASKFGFSQDGMEFLDDITIENSQCYKQAEIYSNILAGLMDARASVVSNNLNVLMKTLNIITIGIMVPTLVVSVFSMNVRIPLAWHAHAFWLIMTLAAISVAAFLLIWRWQHGNHRPS